MQDLNYTIIAQRMKQIRKDANYTQEQIANDLNCTPAYISNIENNRAKLNLRILSYYSKLCGVPMEYFLDSTHFEADSPSSSKADKKMSTSKEEDMINKELWEILHFFSISQKKKMLSILKILKDN